MWYELTLSCIPQDKIDALNSLLEDTHAVSVTLCDAQDDPVYEPALNSTPLWKATLVKALYETEDARLESLQQVKYLLPDVKVSLQDIEDKAWEREWLKDFKPMQFGKRLWICPSHTTPPAPSAVNILLDPGLAFGTGTHETTSLCLSYLDSCDLKDKTICDYGTGSGILAIAALKLGAKKAYAVDIDPQAIQATRSNAKQNDISDATLDAFLVDERPIPTVDLLIANILSGPLIALLPIFKKILKKRGHLILSGLLSTQKASVIEAYRPSFTFIESESLGEWERLVFEN